MENIFVRKYLFLKRCFQALITSSVGNICCENVLLPHHRCNSISALLCEVNLSPAIYFTFKKLFVVSHFTALWFILYFALSVVFLLLQLWQQSFLLWKVTLWKSILSRQLERELQKWTLPKAQRTWELSDQTQCTGKSWQKCALHTFVIFYLVSTT